MRTNLTAILAVWAAIGPMTGIVLGHFLTRSLEEKRWHLDNRTQEYRELLSSLATAYMNMLNFKGGDKDEYFRVERLKMESFRVLRDRILIADEIASADIVRLWAQAFHNFEANKDEKIFADRFTKINETLVSMARKTP
jgi:phosphoribosylaminoimidazole-succinocarboxamide synthase